MNAPPTSEKRIREFDQAILRSFAMPPPITSETLLLKQRGLMQPDMFSPAWWAQRGVRWTGG